MAAEQVVRCNLFGSSYLVLGGEGVGVGGAGAAVGWDLKAIAIAADPSEGQN